LAAFPSILQKISFLLLLPGPSTRFATFSIVAMSQHAFYRIFYCCQASARLLPFFLLFPGPSTPFAAFSVLARSQQAFYRLSTVAGPSPARLFSYVHAKLSSVHWRLSLYCRTVLPNFIFLFLATLKAAPFLNFIWTIEIMISSASQ
jgi:hypothetical protein